MVILIIILKIIFQKSQLKDVNTKLTNESSLKYQSWSFTTPPWVSSRVQNIRSNVESNNLKLPTPANSANELKSRSQDLTNDDYDVNDLRMVMKVIWD